MQIEKKTPDHPALREAIDFFYYVAIDAPSGRGEFILPEGKFDLVFSFESDLTLTWQDRSHVMPRTGLIGMMESPITLHHTKPIRAYGIKFKPSGLSSFLNIPMDELANRTVATEDILHRHGVQSLEEQLLVAKNREQAFRSIEKFLTRIWLRPSDPRVSAAVSVIQARNGRLPVDKLAIQLNISPRFLHMLCLHRLGMAPKTYSSLVRFQHAIEQLKKPYVSLTQLTYEFDFADQSHFNKSFKRFAGFSPGHFKKIRTISDFYNF